MKDSKRISSFSAPTIMSGPLKEEPVKIRNNKAIDDYIVHQLDHDNNMVVTEFENGFVVKQSPILTSTETYNGFVVASEEHGLEQHQAQLHDGEHVKHRYSLLSDRIKVDTILARKPESNVFHTNLVVPEDVTVGATKLKGILFTDKKNNILGYTPPFTIEDADGNKGTFDSVSVLQLHSKCIVEVKANQEFLDNAVYPVTIDPTVIGTETYSGSFINMDPQYNQGNWSCVLSNGTMAQLALNSTGNWSFNVSTDGGNTWTGTTNYNGSINYASIFPTADGLGFWFTTQTGNGSSCTAAASGGTCSTTVYDYLYAMRWTASGGFSPSTGIGSASHSWTYTNNNTTSQTYSDSWSFGWQFMSGDTIYAVSRDTNGTAVWSYNLSGGTTSSTNVAVTNNSNNPFGSLGIFVPTGSTTGFTNTNYQTQNATNATLSVQNNYASGGSSYVTETVCTGVTIGPSSYTNLFTDGNGGIYFLFFNANNQISIYKRANNTQTSTAGTWSLWKTITGLPPASTNPNTQRVTVVPSTGQMFLIYDVAPSTTGYSSQGDLIVVDLVAGTFKTLFTNTANLNIIRGITAPPISNLSNAYASFMYESANSPATTQYNIIKFNIPPSAPTWKTQPANNANYAVGSTINLAWNASTVGDSGDTLTYTLQQSISGGAWTNVATGLTGTSYTYTVPNNAGSNLKFQVIANESNSQSTTSAVSNTVNIVAVPSSPTAGTEPTILKPSSANSLTWNSVSPQGGGDTITYTLQYKDVTANGSWTNIATGVTGTTYSWTPSPALTAGHNYSVQVIAVENDGGQSTPTVIINNMPTFVPMSSLILPQPNNPSAKVNIDYLRTQVNTFRSNNGRSAWNWTDPTIIAGITPVKAVHMTEIQQAIDDVYTNLSVAYSSPSTQTEVKQTVVSKDPINFPIREMSTRLQYILKALQNN